MKGKVGSLERRGGRGGGGGLIKKVGKKVGFVNSV